MDLMVIPDRGRAARGRWFMGPTANKVVEHADCAVLVLRAPVAGKRA